MRYFVPTLALGALSPPQTQLTDKFGGLPWGLPAEKWPLCAECGNPQTHLATFTHSAGRLDLGAEGRTVLIFQCGHSPNETGCETLFADTGANAVVFLDAHELGSGLTAPPAPGTPREIEMLVMEWVEQHDLVTAELEISFYDATRWYDAADAAREVIEDSISSGPKMGSVPCWMQEPERIDPAFYFAAQLSMYYHFPDPLPTADAAGATISFWNGVVPFTGYQVSKPTHPDPSLRGQIYVSSLTLKRYGSGFDVESAEFGDGGNGYLFINPDPVAPQGLFSWQCG